MQTLWFDELWFRVYSQPYKGSVRSEGSEDVGKK